MIKFNKPINLNGSQLRKELNAAGVKIDDTPGAVYLGENGDLFLDINNKDKTKAEAIVNAHIGIDETQARAEAKAAAQAKLAALGLTVDDLTALGLGSN